MLIFDIDKDMIINMRDRRTNIKLAAFILCIISTASMGIFIIPLAWCIPMTISVYKAYQGEKTLSVGFKVCTLLFVSLVAGILLLCDDEKTK